MFFKRIFKSKGDDKEEGADIKFPCPCCGYLTFRERPYNTFYICPVCFWEDDGMQSDDPERADGVNRISLNQAKENFLKFGACDSKSLKYVRKPKSAEIPTRR